jgi:hypothetical protein
MSLAAGAAAAAPAAQLCIAAQQEGKQGGSVGLSAATFAQVDKGTHYTSQTALAVGPVAGPVAATAPCLFRKGATAWGCPLGKLQRMHT